MIIQVDKKGKNAIEQFCDLALKVGGMHNRKQVNLIIDNLVVISDPKSKSKSEPEESKKNIEVTTQLLSEKKTRGN